MYGAGANMDKHQTDWSQIHTEHNWTQILKSEPENTNTYNMIPSYYHRSVIFLQSFISICQ